MCQEAGLAGGGERAGFLGAWVGWGVQEKTSDGCDWLTVAPGPPPQVQVLCPSSWLTPSCFLAQLHLPPGIKNIPTAVGCIQNRAGFPDSGGRLTASFSLLLPHILPSSLQDLVLSNLAREETATIWPLYPPSSLIL